jgi:hypothetical protein
VTEIIGRKPKSWRKVLLCVVSVVAAYLLLTPWAKLTISYGPLFHTGDITPYGIRMSLANLRPYPQSSDSFLCGKWVKVWNAKGELIINRSDDGGTAPICSLSLGPPSDFDRHSYWFGPFSEAYADAGSPFSDYLPSAPPGTYTIQLGIGSVESNKLVISVPEAHKAN